jgi:hypothetical protein
VFDLDRGPAGLRLEPEVLVSPNDREVAADEDLFDVEARVQLVARERVIPRPEVFASLDLGRVRRPEDSVVGDQVEDGIVVAAVEGVPESPEGG